MTPPDKMQAFAEDFPDIQVTVDEIGNLDINVRDTERRVLLQPSWMGWDEQTSTPTDLHLSIVERNGHDYARYDFNPFTERLDAISYEGQPLLGDTLALAQRGISAVQAYSDLPHDVRGRASGIVYDKSGAVAERLNDAATPENILGLVEMSAAECFLFFKTTLGNVALKHL